MSSLSPLSSSRNGEGAHTKHVPDGGGSHRKSDIFWTTRRAGSALPEGVAVPSPLNAGGLSVRILVRGGVPDGKIQKPKRARPQGIWEIVMGDRFSSSIVTAAIGVAAVSAVISMSVTRTPAQAPSASGSVLKTPWGEPDLQGIWTDEFDTPLQRSAKYAQPGVFHRGSNAPILDKARSAILARFATER